jgi:hypothetical protein
MYSGCATQTINTSFSALEAPDTEAYYSSGWIVQQRESDGFTVRLAVRDGKRPWDPLEGAVYIQNHTEEPILVSMGDISLRQDEYDIDLLSYNELTQQYVSQAQSRRTALALGALFQGLSASQPQTTTTYDSGTVYGPGGSASYYGTSQSYSINPAESAAAQAQIQSNVRSGTANIEANLQQKIDSMDGYLQKTTIFPGKMYGGRFQSQMTRFDQKPESTYRLTVTVDTKQFDFRFVEEADIQTQQRKLF